MDPENNSDPSNPNDDSPNHHLRLAAHWAATAITHAQTEMLSSIHSNITQAKSETDRQSESLESLDQSFATSTALQEQEMKELECGIRGSCDQLDQLAKLVDALDKNIDQLETQMSKAETAVGLSLTGRLEQLARFFGSSASAAIGGSNSGVPYLRQWAPRDRAIPQIVNVSEYLD
ncbi:hypothetical protein LPJ81_001050 [Coemansia sp. IMI 209127]|nr:hypothetical protein LPJ81_001050 [Coemansia sp. IMI 209127]